MNKISVVIPCLNEEETIAVCVTKSLRAISQLGYQGEVIVVDNDSSDNSAQRAKEAGAKVVTEKRRGYGSACLRGFEEASGDILVIGDADNTYDFLEIPRLVGTLNKGFDFVVGSRLKGKIVNGAMPWIHRHIGTPVLTMLLRLFFGAQVVDSQSGFRAIRKSAYDKLNLCTTGMEFASEMIIKGLIHQLRIAEVSICYYPRVGKSKLRSTRDAWRHIRFMLLYSPDYLFILPGIFLLLFGFGAMLALLRGPIILKGYFFDIHYLVFGSLAALVGYQILTLGVYAKTFSMTQGLSRGGLVVELGKKLSLEKGVFMGLSIFTLGFILALKIVFEWVSKGMGPLNEVRLGIFASVLVLLGIQIIFSSFFLSILGLAKNEK